MSNWSASDRHSFLSRRLAPVGIGLTAFALIWGSVIIFPGLSFQVGLSSVGLASIGIVLLLGSFLGRGKYVPDVPFGTLSLLTCLYFMTELLQKPHSFGRMPFPGLLWATLTLIYFLFFRGRSLWYLGGLAGVTVFAALSGFLYNVAGRLIFSDDHPSFLYRIIQLRDNFPDIPFYNPSWNGGVEAREFFASGMLNIFFLFSPVIYLFDPTRAYSYIVLSLLFLVVPVLAFLTGRLLKLPLSAIAIYITLSITSSFFWYRWALHYGTLGFICSSALIPPNLALFSLLIRSDAKVPTFLYIVTPITATLMLFWSPSALLMLPLIPIVFLNLPALIRQKKVWLMSCLLLLFNIPWMVTFIKVSKVADFVATSQSQESMNPAVEGVSTPASHDLSRFRVADSTEAHIPLPKLLIKRIRTNSLPLNPLVLLFGIPGIFYFREKRTRAVFGVTCVTALVLGVFGPSLKPQLELERMIVVLGILLALPASLLISEIINKHSRTVRVSALIGIISLSPFWIWRITSNLNAEKYAVASPLVENIVSAISNNSNGGRTLFAGFMLHELSQGHIAPLAAWTGQPLIASSYQHDRWRYTDVIPLEYRERGQNGVLEYLDLMNVSSVVTHDKFWRLWFERRRDLFEKVWEEGKFKLFRRKRFSSSYFLDGEGQVMEQRDNKVILSITSGDAVIKFNYLPFLKVSNCSISPASVGKSLTFIRLTNCRAGIPVEISATDMIERLF